jgi:hypothetical protein
MRRLAIAIIAASITGCTVHQAEAPTLSGPSTLATSVTMTASPDIIVSGPNSSSTGGSSLIVATLRDAAGNPIVGRQVTFDTNETTPNGCGLQSNLVITDAAGRAATTFVAPGYPATGFCSGLSIPTIVTIVATPVGTDFIATSRLNHSVELVINRAAP